MAGVLALAGFMGSGKTSVGTSLAGKLGWGFVDLDTSNSYWGAGSTRTWL